MLLGPIHVPVVGVLSMTRADRRIDRLDLTVRHNAAETHKTKAFSCAVLCVMTSVITW